MIDYLHSVAQIYLEIMQSCFEDEITPEDVCMPYFYTIWLKMLSPIFQI